MPCPTPQPDETAFLELVRRTLLAMKREELELLLELPDPLSSRPPNPGKESQDHQ